MKILVGIAPNCAITFLSDPYPGSATDKEVVLKSGVMEQMETGDGILVDKGFHIQDICPPGKIFDSSSINENCITRRHLSVLHVIIRLESVCVQNIVYRNSIKF